MESSKKWIKQGIAVVAITNLEKIYFVEKIVFKSVSVVKNGEPCIMSKIIGVECSYVGDNGKKIAELLHSKELVPLSVAEKGKSEAIRFINREGEYKNY
jgi:hypothetical protein